MSDINPFVCRICGKLCNSWGGLSTHIRKSHSTSSEEYYNKFLKKPEEGLCEECKIQLPFKLISRGYSKFCSSNCSNNSEITKNKSKETYFKKNGCEFPSQNKEVIELRKKNYLAKTGFYHWSADPAVKEKKRLTCNSIFGVDNPYQNESIKEKIKQTNIERYGCEYPLQSRDIRELRSTNYFSKTGFYHQSNNPEVREKIKQTIIERYGCENSFCIPWVRDKAKSTIFDRYGKQFFMQTLDFSNKSKVTMMRRYGCENPMQCSSIFNKWHSSSLSRYSYTLPSGKIVNVQGYEPKALDLLLQYFDEDEIIAGNATKIPRISYFFNKKEHYYFPDIWIPSINTLIEVKSSWTMNFSAGPLTHDINIAKHNFAEEQGYDHIFLVL